LHILKLEAKSKELSTEQPHQKQNTGEVTWRHAI